MDLGLKGKRAIITGSTRGIGRAIANQLVAEGVKVALCARDEAAAQVPAVLLGRYEELAGQYGGVAVARYVDGRCDGCHIQLSAVARDQLTRAAEDAVVNCEECGRLLVR